MPLKILTLLRNLLLSHPRNKKVLAHALNKISWHSGCRDICILAIVEVSKTIKNKAVENKLRKKVLTLGRYLRR